MRDAEIAGSSSAQDWQAVRNAGDIQFAPVAPPKPQPTPEWLDGLSAFLDRLFKPLGEALGTSWPTVKVVLIALAVLGALWLLWRLVIEPLLDRWRIAPPAEAAGWTPPREASVALLADADRLAAEGRFDEATHMLLRRSVDHIVTARPDWLRPASTAREIAVLPALPAAARRAFATISARVERSRYARKALDAADWHAARAAYTDFALQELTTQELATQELAA